MRPLAFAAAVLCSTAALAEEAEAPPYATYVLRSQADRCDPSGVAPPFRYVALGRRCAVAWKGGRTAWFDAVYAVRPVIDEGPRLVTTQVPLYVARQGREWYFGRGADKGPPFREVWEYRDVLDVRYWTAHAAGSFHLFSAGSPGWLKDQIDGPIRLKDGLPDFALFGKVATLDPRPAD